MLRFPSILPVISSIAEGQFARELHQSAASCASWFSHVTEAPKDPILVSIDAIDRRRRKVVSPARLDLVTNAIARISPQSRPMNYLNWGLISDGTLFVMQGVTEKFIADKNPDVSN